MSDIVAGTSRVLHLASASSRVVSLFVHPSCSPGGRLVDVCRRGANKKRVVCVHHGRADVCLKSVDLGSLGLGVTRQVGFELASNKGARTYLLRRVGLDSQRPSHKLKLKKRV